MAKVSHCVSSACITSVRIRSFPDFGYLPFRSEAAMTDDERLKKLRHDLSNPLSAMLAEVQLLLLDDAKLDPEIRTSLKEVEALAIRMRGMLREI